VKLNRVVAFSSPHMASHVIKSNFAKSKFVFARNIYHESSSSLTFGTMTLTLALLCVKYSKKLLLINK